LCILSDDAEGPRSRKIRVLIKRRKRKQFMDWRGEKREREEQKEEKKMGRRGW
jgi:hypothetical protein